MMTDTESSTGQISQMFISQVMAHDEISVDITGSWVALTMSLTSPVTDLERQR